jgi:hypothetical protein
MTALYIDILMDLSFAVAEKKTRGGGENQCTPSFFGLTSTSEFSRRTAHSSRKQNLHKMYGRKVQETGAGYYREGVIVKISNLISWVYTKIYQTYTSIFLLLHFINRDGHNESLYCP